MRITKRPRLRLDLKSFQLLRNSILRRDGWQCQSCGSRMGLEVHHITPRSKLGDDVEENLIALCRECHRRIHLKRDLPPHT
jgi:5-methylcytosine-specific restriction endonuclease McrA